MTLSRVFLYGFFAIICSFIIWYGVANSQIFLSLKQVELEETKLDSGLYKQQLYDGYSEVWVYETPSKEYGYQILEYLNDKTISTGYGPESSFRTFIEIKPDYTKSTTTNEKIE